MTEDALKHKGLWRYGDDAPEGKFLVLRRDGTVPEWPNFVLGARDPAAAVALRAYAMEAERLVMASEYVHDVLALADEFDRYRKAHGDGDPGAPPHRKDKPEIIEDMKKGRCS